MERSSFEIFKSNICHLVKDKGELSFIRDMLCSDEVSKLYDVSGTPNVFTCSQ